MARINQHKIAKLTQVSQATVSRVLNGDPRVADEIRERVLAVVRAHNYVPDSAARSLRSQRSGMIGFVANRSPHQLAGDPFFSALIAGIIETGSLFEYHLCVDAARDHATRRAIYEDLLRTRRVDGLVLIESQMNDERLVHLRHAGFPFVLIGRNPGIEPMCTVDNDNVGAAAMATQHLLARGHRRIGYIGGPSDATVSIDRQEGYATALVGAGIPVDPALACAGDFTEEGGARAMRALLDAAPPPTAVLAVDDVTAVGAMRAARERGRTVPEQVAIVGFNNSWFCPYVDPPLTSVSIDVRALATAATEMLIQQIDAPSTPPDRRLIPCQFIVREST